VDFIEEASVSTTKQLEALLKYDKITYDLLWALFKPKMILYITCPGTQKSRCIKYDFGEEKKLSNGIILYAMPILGLRRHHLLAAPSDYH
jgi:hypothetical protein